VEEYDVQPDETPSQDQGFEGNEGSGDAPQDYSAALQKMHEATQEAADLKRQLQDYQKWADPMKELYNQRPDVKQFWDGVYNNTNQANTLDPRVQEMDSLRSTVTELKWQNEFNQMRNEGFDVTPEMENNILEELAKGNVRDPRTAYKALAYEMDVGKAADQARADTANKIASGQASYRKPPSKGAHKEQKADMRGKSTPDKLDDFMSKWGDADFTP
jgi:hypothetical protein